MKKNLVKNILAVSIAVFSLTSIAWFQITKPAITASNQEISKDGQSNYSQEEFLKMRTRIFELRNQQDLDGLVALQEEIENSWGKDQPVDTFGINKYAGLMYYVCGSFASQDFKNDKQYVLSRKCIEKVLLDRDKMTVSQELAFVQFVSGFRETKAEKDDSENRKRKSEYWFHVWNRLENQLDESFDLSKTPITKSNMTTEERANLDKYNRQKSLNKNRETYLPQFQRFISQTYSNSVNDVSEFETLLNKYLKNSNLKESLLQIVNKN